MFSRQAESHHAESKAPATKGPAFKQVTEEVDALTAMLEPFLEEGGSGNPRKLSAEDAASARGVLEPAIERTLALADRVGKMKAKANEPDPDLQTYGPVMKDKVGMCSVVAQQENSPISRTVLNPLKENLPNHVVTPVTHRPSSSRAFPCSRPRHAWECQFLSTRVTSDPSSPARC